MTAGTPAGTIAIPFKETYDNAVFQAIETATPAAPESATDLFEGFPWPSQAVTVGTTTTNVTYLGLQIQKIVSENMPGIVVGFSPATVDRDARVNFYGALNPQFGQATALVHYAGLANADFNLTAVDAGTIDNDVQVIVESDGAVNGNDATVNFFATGGGVPGGILDIDIDSGVTTALTVVNAINAASTVAGGFVPFTASLDASEEIGGTNTGTGLVGLITAGEVTTAGGIANGIMTWADTTGYTPQVEDATTAWGQVWTWRLGANNTGGPDAPLSGTGAQSEYTNAQLIPFGAGDSADTIAEDITNAINHANAEHLFSASATQDLGEVALTNVSTTVDPTAEAPITIAGIGPNGSGPGGNITGLAYLPDDNMYAVSDAGGVYWIENPNSPEFETLPNLADPNGPDKSYATPDLQLTGGGGRRYGSAPSRMPTGMPSNSRASPPDHPMCKNGMYADMLFAISTTGVLYAIEPQLFNGDPTSVAGTDLPQWRRERNFLIPDLGAGKNVTPTDVTGLAFSTLDYNLWHASTEEAADVGHGQNPTYDESQVSLPGGNGEAVEGGTSFYFGLEQPPNQVTEVVGQPNDLNYYWTNPALYNTYNLPDGAAGSLDTQTFSLANYTTGDQPMLYFNYNLNKGDPTNNGTPAGFDFDTAKIFASNDGSNWTELPGEAVSGLADSGGNWLQAEYSLAGFAGDSTVRLRFDFSTAGDMGVGETDYTGSYLTALSGEQINDGDTFEIDNQTFEFDMGYALFLPNAAGDVIQNDETFTVTTEAGSTTFQFVSSGTATTGDVAIPYVVGETTAQVGAEIEAVVNAQALTNAQGATDCCRRLGQPRHVERRRSRDVFRQLDAQCGGHGAGRPGPERDRHRRRQQRCRSHPIDLDGTTGRRGNRPHDGPAIQRRPAPAGRRRQHDHQRPNLHTNRQHG